MCLLCYIEPNAPVNWTGLETACVNNPDGFGWAIHLEDEILVGRSMDSTEAIEGFHDARKEYPDTHAMFHARWATHGAENLANVHPFEVNLNGPQSGQTILAHNGIIPISIPKGDWRSDTRYFAEEIMPMRAQRIFDKPDKVQKLAKFIGGSKLVVFTTDPQFDANVYIINESMGHWKEGTWWSNDSYADVWWSKYSVGKKSSTSSTYTGGWKPSEMSKVLGKMDNDLECLMCGFDVTDEGFEYGYCTTCSCCLDCFAPAVDCYCYNPTTTFEYDPETGGYSTHTGKANSFMLPAKAYERGYEATPYDAEDYETWWANTNPAQAALLPTGGR
jgi:hypothetical protein